MKPKALVLALAAVGATLPNISRAADASATDTANQWAQLFVYVATPYCQVMANGMRVCQPVGLVGPAPSSALPGPQPLMPVPLAPPMLQVPSAMAKPNPAAPYMMVPYAPPPGVLPPPMPVKPAGPQYMGPRPMPPQFTMPQMAMPQMAMPQMAMPQMAMPQMAMPQMAMPQMAMPQFMPSQHLPSQYVAAQPMTTQGMQVPTAKTHAQTPPAPVSAPVLATAPATEIKAILPAVVQVEPASPAPTEPATAAISSKEALVRFEFDSAELRADDLGVLDAWLAQTPKGKPVRVSGHADRLGPRQYNRLLSVRRAEAVKQYLADKGLPADAMQLRGMGEAVPVVHCEGGPTPATKACLAPNRRVVISSQ